MGKYRYSAFMKVNRFSHFSVYVGAILFSVVVISCATHSQAPSDAQLKPLPIKIQPDGDFHPVVDKPAFVKKHPRICLDQAHNNLSIEDERYAPIRSLLESDGFQFHFLKSAIVARALKPCDILYISAAQWRTPEKKAAFDKREVQIIARWVRRGGALLLMSDHPPKMAESVEALMGTFGIHGSLGTTEDTSHALKSLNDPSMIVFSLENGGLNVDHSIVKGTRPGEGLRSVIAFTGQSLIGPPESQGILRLSDEAVDVYELERRSAKGRFVMMTVKIGKGCVAASGDATLFTSKKDINSGEKIGINHPGIDNTQLAINTFRWLAGVGR